MEEQYNDQGITVTITIDLAVKEKRLEKSRDQSRSEQQLVELDSALNPGVRQGAKLAAMYQLAVKTS